MTILEGFLQVYVPMITETLDFGDSDDMWDCIYPKEDHFAEIRMIKGIKLNKVTIKYRSADNIKHKPLQGIKLGFTHHLSSRMFESTLVRSNEIRILDIDTD